MAQGDKNGSEATQAEGDQGTVGQAAAGAVGTGRRLVRRRVRKGSPPRPLTSDDNYRQQHEAEWEAARARIYTLAHGLAQATSKINMLTNVGADTCPVKWPNVPAVSSPTDMNQPDPDQLEMMRAKLEVYIEHLELVEEELREFRIQQVEKALL